MEYVIVDGNSLKIEDICRVAYQDTPVSFPGEKGFFERLKKARAFLEEYIAKGLPTYGITTGFGDSCHNQISHQKAALLQKALVNYHGIGLGEKFNHEEGRAIVLCRLNSNVKNGHSAIRPELAEFLKMLLNKDIVPVIPQLGSVGASGDLTPLSYLGAVIMGEREVYYRGKIVSAKEAFEAEGIVPLPLQAKEGLALMNGTSVMTAVAALTWKKTQRLSRISDFLTAATAEIIQGNDVPFRSRVSQMKNHKGQLESADYIYRIVKESKRVYRYEELLQSMEVLKDKGFMKRDKKIQDRYSIRCAPQINGVLRDTLIFTKEWIEEEINSANDNPLVDIEQEALYNTGNFYGGHICAVCDYLRVAVANICDLSDKQAEIIIDGKFNGLTENLIPRTKEDAPEAGLRFAFKAAQITISAIRAEVQYLAAAMSIHSSPTEALNQDKVSMGTISSRKWSEQVKLAYLQFAVHILAVCQAVDLIGVEDFSPFTQKVYAEVRKISAFVEDDRALDREAERVAQMLEETELFSEGNKEIGIDCAR